MIPRKQFENWMRHQLFIDLDMGPCVKFVVKHVSSASRAGSIIITLEVPREEGQLNDDWITSTIDNIENTTAADAAGIPNGGVQSYVVFAFHDDSDKPKARFAIKMAGENTDDYDDISSEPATKTGVLAQMMRHQEAIMRSATMQTANVMGILQKTTQQQAAIIEKLVEEKFNNIDTVEALLSQKNERDLQIVKANRDMELKEKAFDTLKMVAPTIMNRLLTSGKPENIANPQAIASRDLQLASLADSMTGEQLEKLQQVFNTEQLMTFLDVFSQIKKQQELAAVKESQK